MSDLKYCLYSRDIEESSDESDTEMEVDGTTNIASTSKAKHDIIIKQHTTICHMT